MVTKLKSHAVSQTEYAGSKGIHAFWEMAHSVQGLSTDENVVRGYDVILVHFLRHL